MKRKYLHPTCEITNISTATLILAGSQPSAGKEDASAERGGYDYEFNW